MLPDVGMVTTASKCLEAWECWPGCNVCKVSWRWWIMTCRGCGLPDWQGTPSLLVSGLLLPVWCVGARTRFLMTRCTIPTFVNVFAGNLFIHLIIYGWSWNVVHYKTMTWHMHTCLWTPAYTMCAHTHKVTHKTSFWLTVRKAHHSNSLNMREFLINNLRM